MARCRRLRARVGEGVERTSIRNVAYESQKWGSGGEGFVLGHGLVEGVGFLFSGWISVGFGQYSRS